ncbi:glycoside hydrolase [Olivibacter sp. SDN3]|uniref:alpha-L-rhamnosidase-related protein n=1 Tax=Olivibacter sp. SDN3 TaxID=2764720 RepID=UPI0016518B5C|nr:glycoside hydrolase [Olivibacter sp. SDN3]QNL50448.1 glycoside hydrolase [Olivibacter sp. SDN3]
MTIRCSLIRFIILFILMCPCFLHLVYAQDFYGERRNEWLRKAEENKPVLHERLINPVNLGRLEEDKQAFQGWKINASMSIDSLYHSGFTSQSGVIVDFGAHYTGHFSFSLENFNSTPDAPLRLKFTFGEVPAELAVPFDPYPGGLSRAWLQDEIVTVTEIPTTITIPRRLAFRYVKVELISPSIAYDFKIANMQIKATTSANSEIEPLSAATSSVIRDIDRIGLITLQECMQTVYEDGPKRDQRLWIGDLYLEALANNFSFKNHGLTKRCLYLLAALSDLEGYLHGTVFEKPKPHPQEGQKLLDYALLYNVALKDYYEITEDKETAVDLWPVAKKQLELLKLFLDETGMIDYDRAAKDIWIFIDWKDGLHKAGAIQGLAIYSLKETYALAKRLNKENEVAELPALIRQMTDGARKQFFDKESNLFVSGEDQQVSYASQIWMVLGGVTTKKEGANIVKQLMQHENALTPGGPYLYHYFLQAMINCGMGLEAKEIMLNYWGKMVEKGADTFWEVYDPKDEYKSPYNFYPMNSYCHAWSCTPVYFIRKYPDIFQK